VKPKEHKKGKYVDATGIDRRRVLLPGEALISESFVRESAPARMIHSGGEVIVLNSNEL